MPQAHVSPDLSSPTQAGLPHTLWSESQAILLPTAFPLFLPQPTGTVWLSCGMDNLPGIALETVGCPL